jgi:hypothetical protein
LPSPNLTEIFSNKGFAANCIVILAVEINGLFLTRQCGWGANTWDYK